MLSPQGRHNATYNEHMPMKEPHTAMQPACPGEFPFTNLDINYSFTTGECGEAQTFILIILRLGYGVDKGRHFSVTMTG